MHYVLVIAPMDQTFVGPFYQREAAESHALTIRQERGFDAYPMTAAEREENESTFGPLPLQSE